jgi:short-subunit dehydrogenase
MRGCPEASSRSIAPIATSMPDASRTIVITGASSGIGRALAPAAAREGFRVIISARRGERLDEVARSIREGGGACVTVAGDVTSREIPLRIVNAAMEAFGRIDVVVNAAGIGAYGALLEQSDAAIEAQWQLHVAAPLRLARAAIGFLETTRGQLVFVGSGVARVPLPDWGAYGLAKAGIRAAAIQLRRELRGHGVMVTYVDPGAVATEFHDVVGIDPTTSSRVSPERVARAILRGIARRAAVVSAVPWQTAATVIGELAGTLADSFVIGRFTARRAASALPSEAPPMYHPDRSEAKTSEVEGPAEPPSFEQALEPVGRRMERVKLPIAVLRDALVPGAALELNALAMQWAGMPNKNERAALREVLDALADAGYLELMEVETWRVVRAAE